MAIESADIVLDLTPPGIVADGTVAEVTVGVPELDERSTRADS